MKTPMTATLAAGVMAAALSGVVSPRVAHAVPQDPAFLAAPQARALGDLDFITDEAVLSVQIASSVALVPLTAAELLGIGTSSVDLGAWYPGADPTLGVTPSPTVSRSVDALWSAWITGSVNRVDVQVSLVGANGRSNHLSHPSRPAMSLPVSLSPRPPVQIGSFLFFRQVQGGLDLKIDTSPATVAGDYEGTLIVTISQY